jgi:putative ABC transport system permease protein
MLRNYFKISIRHLLKNKVFSAINLFGLAIGMSVALLIGLWLWDELSFNHYHTYHERLGEIVSVETFNAVVTAEEFSSVPIAAALRNDYPEEINKVALTREINASLVLGTKKVNAYGYWAESELPAMLTLKMKQGSYKNFSDPSAVMISESLAKNLFGDQNPINKIISFNNEYEMKVSGVYEDLPSNTDFNRSQFFSSWENKNNTGTTHGDDWLDHHFQVFVQLRDLASFEGVSSKIKNLTKSHIAGGWEELMIHPMDKWHLHTDFKGKQGRIQFVWLFGIIGIFVLILACINYMNLSTAKSEQRAKEIGIRKTLGSSRKQLIAQFMVESFTVTFFSSMISVMSAWLSLPYFNLMAGKQISIPWTNPIFWISLIGFTMVTGILAGGYPAFFLSGFSSIKVLKGNFKTGKHAFLPRKIMVVIQFTVCTALLIGTIFVYQQIQLAKNRPIGYSTDRLIISEMKSESIRGHYEALRNELLNTGLVENVAESSSPSTEVRNGMMGYGWPGKNPNQLAIIGTLFVSYDFGKTIDWKIMDGRDFSRSYPTDSGAFILNEAAVDFTGLKNPVGQSIHWHDKDHLIIGVVKNMIMESPYKQADPVFFTLFDRKISFILIRIKQSVPSSVALGSISKIFNHFDSDSPFEFSFTADNYNMKFSDEEHIGNISSVFCLLSIIISGLGLFGLASYIVQQRTREIAVRKILGASVFSLWKLICSEFIQLVFISFLLASPITWYFSYKWLLQYEFRITISIWVFLMVAGGTLFIALFTISTKVLRAALLNPSGLLRSE